MSLISIILTLVVAGVILYLINLIPMQATVKKIINVISIIIIVIWLLKVFGLLHYITAIHV